MRLICSKKAWRLSHGGTDKDLRSPDAFDGLEDAYEAGRSMALFGEDCAAKYQFTH